MTPTANDNSLPMRRGNLIERNGYFCISCKTSGSVVFFGRTITMAHGSTTNRTGRCFPFFIFSLAWYKPTSNVVRSETV